MGQATSTRVVQQLRAEGCTSVFILRGGFDAWLRQDGLVEPRGALIRAPGQTGQATESV